MLDLEAIDDTVGGTRLVVTGELDIVSAPDLLAALRRALRRTRRVELQLGGVELVDSIGLEAILRCRRMAHHRGAELRLVTRTDSAVASLLTRTGLDGALVVHAA